MFVRARVVIVSVPHDTGERFRSDLLEWTDSHTRSFPWRDTTRSRYEVLIAEFFLSRTRADVVADIYEEFLACYPSLDDLAEADRDVLVDLIRPMGMQNRRADALLELADTLEGEVPGNLDALLELPRVGPYVANATLCFADDEEYPIVDRNVERVYGRVFDERWNTLDESNRWEFADDLLPEGQVRRYNLGLLDFASITCTAQSPDCESCFASGYCAYFSGNGERD